MYHVKKAKATKKSQETTSDEQNALRIHFAKIQITVGKNNLYSYLI